jgi:hypothetical protein
MRDQLLCTAKRSPAIHSVIIEEELSEVIERGLFDDRADQSSAAHFGHAAT